MIGFLLAVVGIAVGIPLVLAGFIVSVKLGAIIVDWYREWRGLS